MGIFIPDWWFEFLADKGVIWLFCALVASFIILFKGSDWFVEGAAGAARKFGVPGVIIGATIVSLGTTSPETAVSIMAALSGKSAFAVGNAVGSVICNTALIFGLGCCLTAIPIDKFVINRQGRVKLFAGLGFIGLCYLVLLTHSAVLGRIGGFILLAVLGWYVVKSVQWGRQHHETVIVDEAVPETSKSVLFLMSTFVAGLLLVLLGSRILIASATRICLTLGVSEGIVASTVVAFGTSVPELATAITCVIKGRREILLGNVIGANVLNLLLVIGSSLAITNLQLPTMFYYLHLPVLAVVVVSFFVLGKTGKKNFNRLCGPAYLALYLVYVILQYALG